NMIGLVDYGTGNLTSVANSLDRLKVGYFKGSNPSELSRADKIIFPGIGEAKTAMDSIEKQDLISHIKSLQIPFLGICIGLQLLFDHTEERDRDCIGVIGGDIRKFNDNSLKIPQIGWNKVSIKVDSPLFHGIEEGAYFYFVNSY
ncbi:MAG: imidazole glycerol phosphate synthase subunit HisH, partial [Candidatus Marinimicrobia bacterium]|nr:imidazole glycerol phosphate synthase subunit HisH [Candidatus Neomarinimicrobiota bacterium]